MLIIRPATQEDAPVICALNKQAFSYDFPPEKTRERLEFILSQPGHRVYAAVCGGTLAGYIHGCNSEYVFAPPLKEIAAIAVFEEYRGKGIGRALLARLEQWAREDGSAGIRLVSGAERMGAHQFYERCGYFLRKEQKNFIKTF